MVFYGGARTVVIAMWATDIDCKHDTKQATVICMKETGLFLGQFYIGHSFEHFQVAYVRLWAQLKETAFINPHSNLRFTFGN
jgi:hypothetical protein